jgi:hypothetical protein
MGRITPVIDLGSGSLEVEWCGVVRALRQSQKNIGIL